MDFRFFTLRNLVAIMGSLTTDRQSQEILTLIEHRRSDLVSKMPLKLCYPAIEGLTWKIVTGCDPKNTPQYFSFKNCCALE